MIDEIWFLVKLFLGITGGFFVLCLVILPFWLAYGWVTLKIDDLKAKRARNKS